MEKRFFYTKEEHREGKKAADLLNEIIRDEEFAQIDKLRIGNWGAPFVEDCQDILDGIVAQAERFAHITELVIGDMDPEECCCSKIRQANYKKLWAAMPQLKELTIKGSLDLSLGRICHGQLEALTIISSGLDTTVIEEIEEAQLPALKKLVLQIGTETYGFDGDADVIKELLENSEFTQLESLGITGSEIQDEVAEVILESKYAKQLVNLDLTGDSLTEKGAGQLLSELPKLEKLSILKLSKTGLSEAMLEKICERANEQKITLELQERAVKEHKQKKYFYTYEEYDDGKDAACLIEDIMSDEEFKELDELIIGDWGGAYEESCQDIIDEIVDNAEEFSHITGLFIGDMDYEECEVSWIMQGDYSELWEAMPQLTDLTIKGSQELILGEISHEKLESLTIICGGLGTDVIEEIKRAKLPSLKKLLLYIGVENYGFDGDGDTIKALLEETNFPKLEYLGITDSEIQDEVTQIVLQSKYIDQISVLDLSCGTITDKGGELLLQALPKLENIREVDLSYNYFSDEMIGKLSRMAKANGKKIDLSDPQEREEWNGEIWYNAMLTE